MTLLICWVDVFVSLSCVLSSPVVAVSSHASEGMSLNVRPLGLRNSVSMTSNTGSTLVAMVSGANTTRGHGGSPNVGAAGPSVSGGSVLASTVILVALGVRVVGGLCASSVSVVGSGVSVSVVVTVWCILLARCALVVVAAASVGHASPCVASDFVAVVTELNNLVKVGNTGGSGSLASSLRFAGVSPVVVVVRVAGKAVSGSWLDHSVTVISGTGETTTVASKNEGRSVCGASNTIGAFWFALHESDS